MLSLLSTVACAVMFWSMHNSSPAMIRFFLLLAGVPNVLLWGLLMLSWYFEKVMPSPKPKRRNPPTKKRGKKNRLEVHDILVFLLGWIAGAFTMGALPAGDLGLTAIWRSRLLSGLYRVGVFLELLLR